MVQSSIGFGEVVVDLLVDVSSGILPASSEGISNNHNIKADSTLLHNELPLNPTFYYWRLV